MRGLVRHGKAATDIVERQVWLASDYLAWKPYLLGD